MEIREATPEEAAAIFSDPNYSTWIIVVDDDGIKGHLCLSSQNGQYFGHNTTFETPAQAIGLWRHAKRHLCELGVEEYFVHIEPETDERIKEFWSRHTDYAYEMRKGSIKDRV